MTGLSKKKFSVRQNLPLPALLKIIGVAIPRRVVRGKLKRGYRVYEASETELCEYFEQAKAMWRKRIASAHPDRNGNHHEAAALNSAWLQLKKRFAKRGIGI